MNPVSAPPLVPVLDAGQAAAWDASSIGAGIPSRVLMDAAGRAVAAAIVRECRDALADGVLVVAGHGNNGGDGWVAARALRALGVEVWVVGTDRDHSPDCAANRDLALAEGVPRLGPDGPWPPCRVTVDAILGTGASGPPKGVAAELARRVADLRGRVVAVDGPTGLDLTSGEAHGPVRAALTVTFGGLRRGHLAARDWCGRVLVAEIGFAGHTHDPRWPGYVDARAAARLVPAFAADMHKGTRGRVLIVGGEAGMSGAVHHAARAALAAGAGLVRLVVAEASVAPLQETVPDATVLASALGPGVEQEVEAALGWADALVLGPGLGRSAPRGPFVTGVRERFSGAAVLDADALQVGRERLGTGGPLVLTPHAGEFASLFPELVDLAGTDRYEAARRAAALVGGSGGGSVLLLKGVPSLVVSGSHTRVVGAGNPALATGGSGDVLSGIIGALLGRKASPFDAAAVGAFAMGRAAELAAAKAGVAATRPADVVAALGAVWAELAEGVPVQAPFLLDLLPPRLT